MATGTCCGRTSAGQVADGAAIRMSDATIQARRTPLDLARAVYRDKPDSAYACSAGLGGGPCCVATGGTSIWLRSRASSLSAPLFCRNVANPGQPLWHEART